MPERPDLDRLEPDYGRFVWHLAHRYKHLARNMEFQDLVGEGYLGLVKAYHNFDGDRNASFITCAFWYIRQAIFRGIAENSSMIQISEYAYCDKLKPALKLIENDPDISDLTAAADRLGIERSDLLEIYNAWKGTVSLEQGSPDSDQDEDEHNLIVHPEDTDPLPDHQTYLNERSDMLMDAIDKLPDKEAEIIRHRNGFNGTPPATLAETGQLVNLSRERTRQLEERAHKRLKRLLLTLRKDGPMRDD